MPLSKVEQLVTHYRDVGKGKTIVLLHGWGSSLNSFDEITKSLTRHYRVISLDLPGFGQTDTPPTPWGISEYIHFLQAFLKQRQCRQCILVGHSFGGRLALSFTAKHPDQVQKLILMASAGVKHEYSAEEKLASMLSRIGKQVFSLPIINKVRDPARWLLYKMIRRQDYYQASEMMQETMKRVIEEDLTPLLSNIRTKTLIIWGEKDDYVPVEDAHLMHRRIRRSRLRIIKNANHYLPKKYTKEVLAEIKSFLRK